MKRKRFTDEQIIRILREAEQEGRTVAEVCRAHGVSENSYYRWRRKFGGLSVVELRRLRELERENARLKRMVAERDLEIDAMKEVLSKNW
jgi:putative transposase